MGALSADADELVIQLALLDHRLHRALLDQLDEGVCMVDRDRRILYWNKGAERISGYFSHEVAGQFSHGDLLMHCDSDDSQGSGEATGPAFLRHREGYRLMVELQSRPIQGPRWSRGGCVGGIRGGGSASGSSASTTGVLRLCGFIYAGGQSEVRRDDGAARAGGLASF